MARRRQEGNLFFRLDVDFFSDRKVKILKARYGADGITLYLYLLCEIYKTGNETGNVQNESKGAYCFRKRYLVEYFQEILRNWIICEQDLRSKQDHYRADCSKTWIPQQCQ